MGTCTFQIQKLPNVQRVQLLLVPPSTPSWIHLILNNTQDYAVQAPQRKKSFLKGFLKMVRKNVFCSLVKHILPMVINITTLSMVSKAGLRTPDCDHFYFGNERRSEYCYAKKFPKVVNSEDFREGSTCFASVKACSFPELPLTYTWGRKKQDSLRRNCLGSHI